eukprot:TRINITY_DN795_c0_g1_i1.p2 TRINITY_DN795_c0_g1~~TRINITY_DN795_c0_g1_i1.p2  ORF type:complete len:59 (-),score=13.01 TRINITY_DN795_c0_g1_i1:5-181(-)
MNREAEVQLAVEDVADPPHFVRVLVECHVRPALRQREVRASWGACADTVSRVPPCTLR